jgi:preprotein translocase subunit SecE
MMVSTAVCIATKTTNPNRETTLTKMASKIVMCVFISLIVIKLRYGNYSVFPNYPPGFLKVLD